MRFLPLVLIGSLLLVVFLTQEVRGSLLSRKQQRTRDVAADKIRAAKRRIIDDDDSNDGDGGEGWSIPGLSGLTSKFRGLSDDSDDLIDDANRLGRKYSARAGKHLKQLKDDHVDGAAYLLTKKGKKYVDDATLGLKDAKRRYIDGERGWRVPVISSIKDKFRRGDIYEDFIDELGNIGKKYVDDAGQKLKETKEEYSEDVDEAADELTKKGKRLSSNAAAKAKEQKRRFVEDDLENEVEEHDDDDDESGTWRIPVISNLADKFRGLSDEDLDDEDDLVEDVKSKSKQYASEAKLKAKNAKRKFVDEEEDDEEEEEASSGWFDTIASKFRGGGSLDDESDDLIDDAEDAGKKYSERAGKKLKKVKDSHFDDAAEKLTKKGKKTIDDAALKAKDAKRRYVDGEKGWRIPVISSIKDKFRGGDASEDLIDDLGEMGKKYTDRAAKKAKLAKDDYSEDIDDAADRLTKQGKKYAQQAAKKAKSLKK